MIELAQTRSSVPCVCVSIIPQIFTDCWHYDGSVLVIALYGAGGDAWFRRLLVCAFVSWIQPLGASSRSVDDVRAAVAASGRCE